MHTAAREGCAYLHREDEAAAEHVFDGEQGGRAQLRVGVQAQLQQRRDVRLREMAPHARGE